MKFRSVLTLFATATLVFANNAIWANISYPIEPFIINGEPSLPEEFPEYTLVFIGIPAINREGRCGGTLIAPNKVLTAAHCTEFEGNRVELSVIPGYHNEQDLDDSSARIAVTKIDRYPNYDPNNGTGDIAVLTLQRRSNKKVAAVFAGPQTLVDKPVSVIGNGLISQTPQTLPSVLQKFGTVIVDNQVCNEFYFNFEPFGPDLICLLQTPSAQNACFGDSGGPLLLSGRRNAVVVGVASFLDSTDCLFNEILTGYTRVSSFTNFIRTHSPETRFYRLSTSISTVPSILDLLLLDES